MRLKKILGKPHEKKKNLLVYEYDRDIDAKIVGYDLNGGPDISIELHFYLKRNADILLMVEIPLVEDEIADIEQKLLKGGGVISAIHNHWLFDEPKLYFLHYQIIGNARFIATHIYSVIDKLISREY